jgi:hypothetical protein
MKDSVVCQENKVPGWSIGEMEDWKNGVLEKRNNGVSVITAPRSEGPTSTLPIFSQLQILFGGTFRR